jgi:hypothetical protein
LTAAPAHRFVDLGGFLEERDTLGDPSGPGKGHAEQRGGIARNGEFEIGRAEIPSPRRAAEMARSKSP